jgi:hypothetical protein
VGSWPLNTGCCRDSSVDEATSLRNDTTLLFGLAGVRVERVVLLPPVITDEMLHTVLRRRVNGESVDQIRPDLIIPTGKRKGQNPGLASIYRAPAEHEKALAYPEAVEQAHVEHATRQAGGHPAEGIPDLDRPECSQPLNEELGDRLQSQDRP